MHVGWHHADVEAVAGDCFHYDHGAGIERNQDGQYVWFPLITVFVNFTFNQETNSFDGEWEPCVIDTNVESERSVYQLALTKGLESKIHVRLLIEYWIFYVADLVFFLANSLARILSLASATS